MHMYTVQPHTKYKLLTQESGKDTTIRDHVSTKLMEFSDENIIIDFVRFKNSKEIVTNMVTRLASSGYYVFCVNNINDKYLMAVHVSQVEVV